MSKIKSTSPYLVRQVDYTTTVKFSLEEHQAAFDAAVSTYRARNQDAPEKAARRVVARII